MKTQRRRHSADFKARAVLEVLKGQRTANEIAADYGIHPLVLGQWKKQALAEFPSLFCWQRAKAAEEDEALKARLYQQIGQLQVELDWLKKKSGLAR